MSYVQYTRRGMGQDDSTPLPTLPTPTVNPFANLFASTDFSTWGVGEWVAIAGVGFLALKLFQGVLSAGGAVKSTVRKRRRRAQKRQGLMDELRSL